MWLFSDGGCLMVAETLGRCMTVLLSSLMEGIYYRFIPFFDIWMMGGDFSGFRLGS